MHVWTLSNDTVARQWDVLKAFLPVNISILMSQVISTDDVGMVHDDGGWGVSQLCADLSYFH